MDKYLGWRKWEVINLVVIGAFVAVAKDWMSDAVAAYLIAGAVAAFFGANVASKFTGKTSGSAEGSSGGAEHEM
jgi:hypothetical protein